jgi:heme/copper-type cytochrome/quinol oxidase subunit 2
MHNFKNCVQNNNTKFWRLFTMMFLLGLIVGGIIGVTVMAMFQINRID